VAELIRPTTSQREAAEIRGADQHLMDGATIDVTSSVTKAKVVALSQSRLA